MKTKIDWPAFINPHKGFHKTRKILSFQNIHEFAIFTTPIQNYYCGTWHNRDNKYTHHNIISYHHNFYRLDFPVLQQGT